LQPIQQVRQEEVKFTSNVAKCDKIYDGLLKSSNIKINHTIPPIDELKRRTYCKWNNFSHILNDCNVFRRQVRSAINEGRMSFQEMHIDMQLFFVNIVDLKAKKVLVWTHMDDKDEGTSIVINDPRVIDESKHVLFR
jgi:hypothetical protein